MSEVIRFPAPPARLFTSDAARQTQLMLDDSLIAQTEFNWIQAARESEARIVANHYCPKMPYNKHNHGKAKSRSRAKVVVRSGGSVRPGQFTFGAGVRRAASRYAGGGQFAVASGDAR